MKLPTVAKTTIVFSFISILLVVLGLFISRGSRAEGSAQAEWQPLSKLVSSQQLMQIIADNTAPGANRAEIASAAVGLQKGDLLVVDFETATLCGIGGCAIAAYRVSTGEQLLFTYALQPAGQPIVELAQPSGAELPCLLIADSGDTLTQPALTRSTLCYRNGAWMTEE
ncbi:MAG: hypothetical protein HLUCCA11_20385 [Phormidesmis priestleyi Ana]|uniref:Uncharacterized protein n=1 Tax=Phormidesmis priestleyi Ana TaxID=1666911 RepID=A0A0P8BVJ0_9CYAN|nr:MAG: hypothetical protein HLUCCA11_20385 [Phormidesmis priestleyi Ana]